MPAMPLVRNHTVEVYQHNKTNIRHASKASHILARICFARHSGRSTMSDIGRRDLFKQAAGVMAASAIAGLRPAGAQTPQPGSTLKFFPAGFKPLKFQTSTGVTINGV